MPAKRRLTVRQLRQMLRLAGSGTSSREIAVVLDVARSTVQNNLKRAAQAGMTWPLPGELADDALEHRLFAAPGSSRTSGEGRSLIGLSFRSS